VAQQRPSGLPRERQQQQQQADEQQRYPPATVAIERPEHRVHVVHEGGDPHLLSSGPVFGPHGGFTARNSAGMSDTFQVSRQRAYGAVPRARGFTLIEIMVVVIIIGLLAAVIVPQIMSRVDEARVTKAKQDIKSLETALTMFRLDNSKYPTTEQ